MNARNRTSTALYANLRGYRTKGGAVIVVQRVLGQGTERMIARERRYYVSGRRFVATRHWLAGLRQRWSGSLMRSSFKAKLCGSNQCPG